MANKTLYRSTTDRRFQGVCGGIAEVYDLDSNLVRAVFFALTFASGIGLWLYIGIVLFVPEGRGAIEEKGEGPAQPR